MQQRIHAIKLQKTTKTFANCNKQCYHQAQVSKLCFSESRSTAVLPCLTIKAHLEYNEVLFAEFPELFDNRNVLVLNPSWRHFTKNRVFPKTHHVMCCGLVTSLLQRDANIIIHLLLQNYFFPRTFYMVKNQKMSTGGP